MTSHPSLLHRGFTLIEALIVIVITGIIAGTIAIFIKLPMDGYVATTRRATLTDIADTAVRRIAREIRLALPNSVRNPGDNSTQCIEFIPTKIGGRYRSAADTTNISNPGNSLSFAPIGSSTSSSFDMLWPYGAIPSAFSVAAGDIVVVYNDGSTSGNAYSGANAIQVASVAAASAPNSTTITFVNTTTASPFNYKQLPAASPSNQFQVIPAQSHVVSYYCNGGTLYRYTRTLSAAWGGPSNCANMTSGAASAVLVTNINNSACILRYDAPGSSTGLSRFGIVAISLQVTQSGESVNLYQEVHVDNIP